MFFSVTDNYTEIYISTESADRKEVSIQISNNSNTWFFSENQPLLIPIDLKYLISVSSILRRDKEVVEKLSKQKKSEKKLC